jgi:hypothetical protein
MKSKSFASPYECYLDDSTVTAKKLTMMAFFGHDRGGRNSIENSPQVKQNKEIKNTQKLNVDELWSDGANDDDDDGIVDVDAEFESLLNRTFEQESLRLGDPNKTGSVLGSEIGRSSKTKGSSGSDRGIHTDKASGRGGGKQVGGPVNTASSSLVVGQSETRAQRGFPTPHQGDASSNSDVIGGAGSKMFINSNNQLLRQKGFDPVAALPTSQTKQYAGRRPAPHSPLGDGHSPSPTQSEYDTCDPWDEN